MQPETQKHYTPEEYLALERKAEYKSEYIHGEIVAMAGASRNHNRITLNVAVSLHAQFRNRACEVFSNDMRIRVAETELYTYPDVVAVCDFPQFEDAETDTLLNPTVIIEVLSESTESYDRGAKFAHYRRIGSLQEYLLISQNRQLVEHYLRRDTNKWLLTEAAEQEAVLELPSIGCLLRLADVYDKVEVL
jgi:Uma2 family endonuclease